MKSLTAALLSLWLASAIALAASAAEEASAEPEDGDGASELAAPQPEDPDSRRLRNRDLGDAFREFEPTEEISADNAVPFPSDI